MYSSADEALLKKGWVVAYVSMRDMYGSPASMDVMDRFYEHVIKVYDLSEKVVPEGFSRGGLYAFNWAGRNPESVACIYVDAPVLDFKSWPGGKGKGQGSPKNWEKCLRAYKLTEQQAMAYKLNPVDNLKPLADANIPIICVAGDADKTVPIDENILLAEKRYKEMGGAIQVILKPGVEHHPHSLADPTPVVDFIIAHSLQK